MAQSMEHLAKRRRIYGQFNPSSVNLAINCDIEPRPIVSGPVSSVDGDISTGGDSGFQDLEEESRTAPSTSGLLTPSSIDHEPHSSSGDTNLCQIGSHSPPTMDDQAVNIIQTAKIDVEHCSGRVEKSSCISAGKDQLEQQVAHENFGQQLVQADDTNDDADDGDDSASEISNFSCLSGASGEESESEPSDPIGWVKEQVFRGNLTPRQILQHIFPYQTISPDRSDLDILRTIFETLSPPPKRSKLPSVNLLEDVVDLIRRSSRILVLTGAGVSVSCGIPDFRSKDGLYARLKKEFPTLPNPQAMFSINYFRLDPRPFFKFAKEIYPGRFEPSPSHKFIRQLELNRKLLRNYTQNIDTLEHSAGIKRVINCHGSFATASCTRCNYQVDANYIKEDIFQQRIPLCPNCPPDSPELAVIKPDIVFFGEKLPSEFHEFMREDKEKVDLLIVMGSSLKVKPVSLIPSSIDPSVPQILINREPLHHTEFDVELLGNCDVIIQEITNRLGSSWTTGTSGQPPLTQLTLDDMNFDNCSTSADSQMKRSPQSEVSTNTSQDSCSCRGQNLVDSLPENSYLFIPPSRYIFDGAELSPDDRDSSPSDSEAESDDEDTSDILTNVNTDTTTTTNPSLSVPPQ